MQRLPALDPAEATGPIKELFDGLRAKYGTVPNIARTMGNAPAVLEAYLNFQAALRRGVLSSALREQIALTVAETNRCGYCLAAHSAMGKSIGLSDEVILQSRRAESTDPKVAVILTFARELVETRGWVSDEAMADLRRAQCSDAEIAEIVANVVVNIFSNYFNHVAGTVVDFPPVPELAHACNTR